jgi:hypothetical protein
MALFVFVGNWAQFHCWRMTVCSADGASVQPGRANALPCRNLIPAGRGNTALIGGETRKRGPGVEKGAVELLTLTA